MTHDFSKSTVKWYEFVCGLYTLIGAVVVFLMAYGGFIVDFCPSADISAGDILNPIASSIFEIITNPIIVVMLLFATVFQGVLSIPTLVSVIKKREIKSTDFPYFKILFITVIDIIVVCVLSLTGSVIGSWLEYLGVSVSPVWLSVFGTGAVIAVTVSTAFVILVHILADTKKEKETA